MSDQLFFSSFESLLAVALAVRDLAGGSDREERIALAWTLRNRIAERAPSVALKPGSIPPPQAANRRQAEEAFTLHCDRLDDPQLADALELVVAVWLGDIPDPTNGATACHRHDLQPSWARFKSVKALIGEQLFYG